MGSLLVASTFLNVVSPRDAEPKSAAAGGAASPDSTMQPPSSNSSAASTGTRQPPSAVPAAAVAESGTAAGAGESPASTGNASINHSRQFNVPSLNLSRMSHGGHAGDAHADGGPLTSTCKRAWVGPMGGPHLLPTSGRGNTHCRKCLSYNMTTAASQLLHCLSCHMSIFITLGRGPV